jgi:hypothetical protein
MKDHIKFGIAMILAVTVATLLVLSIQYWPMDKQIQTPIPNQVRLHPTLPQSPIVILDLGIPNFDLQSLKKLSELVVLGKVVKQTQGPAMDLGSAPMFGEQKMPQVSNAIQIEEVLKGNYKGDTLNILTPGTTNNKVIVEDAYKLKNGERAIFMLAKINGGYVVIGYDQGKYQLSGDMVRGKFVKGMDIDNFRLQVLDVDKDVILKEHQQPTEEQSQSQIQSHDQPQKHLSDSQQKTFDKIMKQRERQENRTH